MLKAAWDVHVKPGTEMHSWAVRGKLTLESTSIRRNRVTCLAVISLWLSLQNEQSFQ